MTLGIDLGATKVVSALLDSRGKVLRHSGRHVHANDGPDGVLATVVASARACLQAAPGLPQRVGIGVAAQVDPTDGMVIHAPNLRWRNFPLGERLARELELPVTVVNDARAATFAEWKFGVGVGETDLFCLILGTGVGGSAVLGGQLIEGGGHAAGEVGHITIVSGGRACHCPNAGCFEAYVGGWAIGERAREAARSDEVLARGLLRQTGSVDEMTAANVFRAARAGDPLAESLCRETDRYLADGAVSVVNAFNPSLLILAGGLVAGSPGWVSVVEAAVRSRCQPPASGARVVAASLGEDAGVIGAAALARERDRTGSPSRAASRSRR